MQPNPGPAPGSFTPRPSSPNRQMDKFLERWWVAIPGQLRRYSVYLSETWADGIYLTAWPSVAALAPLLLLLFGFLEGATHWSLMINDPTFAPGEVPLTFTQLLPLMVLTAAVISLPAPGTAHILCSVPAASDHPYLECQAPYTSSRHAYRAYPDAGKDSCPDDYPRSYRILVDTFRSSVDTCLLGMDQRPASPLRRLLLATTGRMDHYSCRSGRSRS
jgi:hypothetical protein